jgi:hypothetical protein
MNYNTLAHLEGGPAMGNAIVFDNDALSFFGRPVDLVEKGSIRNPFGRRAILSSMEVLRAA